MHPRKIQFSARVTEQFHAPGLPRVLALRAATETTPPEILVYDEIGFMGITATDFATALKSAGSGPVNVRINSPGGEVFDGLAIYNMMLAHGDVTAFIDGIAASAASYIAMGAKTVNMAEASQMMIHDASTFVYGNKTDLAKQITTLAKIDGQFVDIYAAKTGQGADDIAAMMAAETYMTATEAKALGFCDNVITPAKASASVGHVFWRAADAANWTVGADRELPIDTDAAWDGPAAAERMLQDAGFNGDTPNPDKAKAGFLVYDAANPKEKGSYKLPFADVVDGHLKALKSGIDAAASRLPDTDIPADAQTKARDVLDAYESRMKSADASARTKRARLARIL